MSIYDPNRVSHKGVQRNGSGIDFGFTSKRFYSLTDILLLSPTNLNSEILLKCDDCSWKVWYPHLIFRVLAVHGISMTNNSKAELRYKVLHELSLRK